jgi:membrane-associated phospholipid phosphatase
MATYVLFVQTVTGQRIENGALRGADQVDGLDEAAADSALGDITVYSLTAVSAVLVGTALLRGNRRLAVAVAALVVGSSVITQVLKRFVLPRPELVPVTGDYTGNSFPSGHTTIAMSVLFALMLVVPYRFRGVAMWVGVLHAVAIGAQTITAKWHRLSDTLGADLIALLVACLVVAWLDRDGAVAPVVGGRYRWRVWLVGVPLGLTTAVALVVGLLVLVLSEVPSRPDETLDYNMYLASHSLALAGSGLCALVFWGALRRLDVRLPERSAAVSGLRG